MKSLTHIPNFRLVGYAKLAPKAAIAFSTSMAQKKTAADKVKDTAKGIEKAISDKIIGSIEMGREFYS